MRFRIIFAPFLLMTMMDYTMTIGTTQLRQEMQVISSDK
jgi:hypothetical protein